MQEDKNIKIDTLPEKKIIKKDKPAIAAPPSNNKIETMQPRIDFSFVRAESPFQSIVDIIICIGAIYGFANVCYLVCRFIMTIFSPF